MKQHFYQTIPGHFNFQSLYEMIVREARSPAHFVEVGSWHGTSAAFMAVEIANSGKEIKLDCVDTWEGDFGTGKAPPNLRGIFTENMRRGGVAELVNPITALSTEAARLYADESLDFVFIDANHGYEFVRADLAAWWPKIKPRGLFAGHDYGPDFPGVARAVDEAFKALEVDKALVDSCTCWIVHKT
jgi:predicted O-methyltransferase YrrM